MSKTCNKDVLEAFGIAGTPDFVPVKSTSDEKAYCLRNFYSCCSATDFENLRTHFTQMKAVFKRKVDLMEELLSLFVGENHVQLLRVAELVPECQNLIENERINIDKEDKPSDIDDFIDNFLPEEISNVLGQLSDLEIYIKKNKFIQGDFLCGICNPLLQKFMRKDKETVQIDISMDTCSELMELDYFENKMAKIYQTTIAFFLRVTQCIQNNDDDEENDIENVLVFDTDKLMEKDEEFEKCYVSNNQEVCKNLCERRNLNGFKFSQFPILEGAKQALEILYPHLAGTDIDEYYMRIKN